MFTGIVEELGEVVGVRDSGDSALLRIRARVVASDVKHGASIAVNGVCLTVVAAEPAGSGKTAEPAVEGSVLDFDVMGETLKRSVIGELTAGQQVNLERATRADSRLDGHIVQGHVDGTGRVLARTPSGAWETFRFSLPKDLARYVAEKGSIAVHGVSLTVTEVGRLDASEHGEDYFEVGLIPETLRATNLGGRQVGDNVNLEVDVLAKYTERLLSARTRDGGA